MSIERTRRPTKAQAESECYLQWAEKDKAHTKVLNVEHRISLIDLRFLQREEQDAKAGADQHRIYTFYGEVDAERVEDCMAELGAWSRRDPGEPMTVLLNSCGGSCIDGIALYDYILSLRAIGHHFTIIALGEASSMGGILLQAADWRVMGATTELLIHEVSDEQIGSRTVSWIRDKHAYLLKLQRRMDLILAGRSTLTALEIEQRAEGRDWFLDAFEALELGFIDEIR